MGCYTLMAMVEWYPSDGALMYEVMATTASGHNVTCEASNASCDLEGLLCGQSYSVSVKALGQTCSSFAHMTGQLVTGNEALHMHIMYFTYHHAAWMLELPCAELYVESCFTYSC